MTMDTKDAVSTIMTTNIITLQPRDTLTQVKEVLTNHAIHHVPIVDEGRVVGIVSKSDLEYYERHYDHLSYGEMLEKGQLDTYKCEDVMTRGLATLPPNAAISEALDMLKENVFHSVLILDNETLVGMVTPHDIICALAD